MLRFGILQTGVRQGTDVNNVQVNSQKSFEIKWREMFVQKGKLLG